MFGGPHESTAPLRNGHSNDLPTGIKILAVVNVLGALLALPIAGKIFAVQHPLAGILGVVVLLFVGAGLAFTYGLVTCQYWGWFGTVVFNVLNGVLDLLTFDILGVIVSGIIVVYLLGKEDLYTEP